MDPESQTFAMNLMKYTFRLYLHLKKSTFYVRFSSYFIHLMYYHNVQANVSIF